MPENEPNEASSVARRRPSLKVGGSAALFSLLIFACGSQEPSAPAAPRESAQEGPPRVLVIGVDGASTWLVESMRKEGLLPNLESIARKGSWGVARPTGRILSPRIWTTVATGKLPEKHGIDNWVWLDDDKIPHLFSSRDRKAHALWNIFTDVGRSAAVVNWLMTHPPEQINGVMMSDHAAEGVETDKVALAEGFAVGFKDRQGTVQVDSAEVAFTYPEEWESRLAALRESPPLTEFSDPFADSNRWGSGPLALFFRKVYRNDEFSAQAALEIDAEVRPDLMLVYLPGIDRISHFIWDSVEPLESIPDEKRRSDFARDVHGTGLRLYYQYVDALIGRLLAGRTDDDLVIVLSDHGFELDVGAQGPRGMHDTPVARDGILYMRGRGVPRGRADLVVEMAEFAPTILAWMGMPPASDMDAGPVDFMDIEVPEAIATYDTTPIHFVGSRSDDVESRIMDDLKELGYVE